MATGTSADGLLNYGLSGLIVVAFVIPMAIYILRDKDRQLKAKDEEIIRLRGEAADLRRVLDPIASSLSEVGRVMNLAISVISHRDPSP